jgi:tetratricopeptide (TPR) repeat protein
VDIATTRLNNDHPQATELLRLAAFLGPDPVPTAWLETTRGRLATLTVDPDDFMWPQTALQLLSRAGLARVDHETFQIHRLTQAIVRDYTRKADTTAAENDVTTLLAATAPSEAVDPVSWPTWAALTSHLNARLHTAAQHPPLHQTLIRAARYLCVSGQARAGRDLAATLHPIWVTALGEEHPDTLGIAQYLGHATADLGEYDEARRIIKDTLERRRRTLGQDHPATLNSANDLATALDLLGEYEEARRLHEDTHEHRRRILGQDHPDTLNSANNLATTLARLRQVAAAEKLLRDAHARSRRTLGENHPQTQRLAENLAQVLTALGRPFEAQKLRPSGGKAGKRRKRR